MYEVKYKRKYNFKALYLSIPIFWYFILPLLCSFEQFTFTLDYLQ